MAMFSLLCLFCFIDPCVASSIGNGTDTTITQLKRNLEQCNFITVYAVELRLICIHLG